MRLVLVLMIMLTGMLAAASQADESASPDSTLTTTQLQFTLPNGMRAVVQSVPWQRLVGVEVFYSAGAATEPDSLAGLAHLSEHLLTESGHHHPEGELYRLQNLYSTYTNAYTSTSSMCFLSQCLPEFLENIMDLEVDRMHGAITDSASFHREKSVVLEELAYRSRVSATQNFQQSIIHSAFPGHPYGRDVAGSFESVRRIKAQDFMDFQAQRISPEKAVLVITGPVDCDTTMEMVRDKFDFGPSSKPHLPSLQQYPPIKAGQIIVDASDHSGYLVGMACRIPLDNELDSALAYALPEMMDASWVGLGLFSVPDEVVVLTLLRGTYFHPPTDPEQHYGMDYPPFDPEQDAQRALGAMWQELYETLDDLQSAEAFEEGISRVLNNLGGRAEASETGSGTGKVLINGNNYLDSQTMENLLQEATPADLQNFVGRFLNPDRAVIGVSHGSDSQRPAAIDMASRVARDQAMKATDSLEHLGKDLIEPVLEVYRQADLFQFEHTTLSNGTPLHCLVIPDDERWFFGGYRAFEELKETRGNKIPGLDLLYNAVVNYDDTQRQDRFDPKPFKELPYNLSLSLRPWRLIYTADGPADRSPKIAQTMGQRFKSREFNNGRWGAVLRGAERSLTRCRNQQNNAASTWRLSQILGDKHPYLSPWNPNPQTGTSVKYKDLKKLHSKVTGKVGNATLVSAGKPDCQAVENAIKETFGRFGERKKRFGFSKSEEDLEGVHGKVFHAPEKGDVLLSLTFAPHPVKKPDESLGTTVYLLREALAMSLQSRLREKEGLTYGVSCHASAMGTVILWEVEVTCQPGQAPLVLASLKDEIAHCIQNGFTEDEWALARLKLLGRYIAAFSEASSGRTMLINLASFGEIPPDPMAMVFAIEAEQVNAMAKDVLDAENFVFTATGPMFEEDIDQF